MPESPTVVLIGHEMVEVEQFAVFILTILVTLDDGLGLGNEGYAHGLGVDVARLDGDVFKVTVVDIVPGERPLVADAASDKALEDERVALHLVFLLELTIREIKTKKVVTFLNGEVVRCPILR